MVPNHERPAAEYLDVPRELFALQFTGVQSAQLPRVGAFDQPRGAEEILQWNGAGRASSSGEYVGLPHIPNVFATNWQARHVAGEDLSGNATGDYRNDAGLAGQYGSSAKYV